MRMSRERLANIKAQIISPPVVKETTAEPSNPIEIFADSTAAPTPHPQPEAPQPPTAASYRFQVTRGDDGKIKEITAVSLTDKPNA
jgi:hypothetical protein